MPAMIVSVDVAEERKQTDPNRFYFGATCLGPRSDKFEHIDTRTNLSAETCEVFGHFLVTERTNRDSSNLWESCLGVNEYSISWALNQCNQLQAGGGENRNALQYKRSGKFFAQNWTTHGWFSMAYDSVILRVVYVRYASNSSCKSRAEYKRNNRVKSTQVKNGGGRTYLRQRHTSWQNRAGRKKYKLWTPAPVLFQGTSVTWLRGIRSRFHNIQRRILFVPPEEVRMQRRLYCSTVLWWLESWTEQSQFRNVRTIPIQKCSRTFVMFE